MQSSETLRQMFIATTIIVIGSICMIRIGTVDMHSICATAVILVPAIVVMV
jgi:hypothetical protein